MAGLDDLTATNLSLSGSTLSFHINNVGTDPAAASTAGIYLSTDNNITTSDTRINTFATPALAAGATDIESVALALPTNLTAGTYYIGVIADYANVVTESDETNNASSAIPIILGNDSLNALSGTAGNDFVFALGGNDTITMGASLTAADQIDGGTGTDTVKLAGDYSAGVTFAANTMVNVETLSLGTGFSYNLTTNDATVAAGQILTVDGSALASGNALTFNGAAETNGSFNVKGGGGTDTIALGATLTAANQITGGAGTDTVTLAGNYSAGLVFSSTTMVGVENLNLGAGFNYNFITNDATVASGQTLTVNGSALAAANTLTVNGAAETNGIFNITAGAGNDVLTGGAGGDTFTPGAGNDTVVAGAGNDTIVMAANLTAADQIDGGAGTDTVTLAGNYAAGVAFTATTMVNVENLNLISDANYNLTTNDATVAAGQTLTVDGSVLSASKVLTFNGAAETDGNFNIKGGAGSDVLTAGGGNDTVTTGAGNDVVNTGAGNDTIIMAANLKATDQIDGGVGTDTVTLAGDYSTGVTFGAATMVNVETLNLGAGFNYNLTTNDATVASGQTLTVDASTLAAANTLTFNGAAETNGGFNVKGGAGNDTIALGATLTAANQINGGAGTDTVTLVGDYSAGLTFGATTMVNVETLNLGAGFNYNLTTNDATVTSGQTLTVDASALVASKALNFNGAAETNGFFNIKGGTGNDTIGLGVGLASDQIDGGAGTDTVNLAGSYAAGVTFAANTMINVETLNLGAGFSYKLTTNDATVAAGKTLTVDGSALGSINTLTFNGAAELDGSFNVKGGASNDVLTGGSGNDAFTSGAGSDIIKGGDGNDTVVMAANLTATDQIDGGNGTDTVFLAGDYSAGLTFGSATMVNVETLSLGAGFNYKLTTNDTTVASGQTLTVDASALAAANTLNFNGAAETNGTFIVKGGAGNDTIALGASLKATSQIDGGAGTDTVTLAGNYSAGVTFGAATMVNVETLTLGSGFNYNLTTNDATVASSQTLTIDASTLGASNTLTFNGAAETNGGFILKGGAGNDTMAVGASLMTGTQINGGAGSDTVTLAGNYSAGLIFGATTLVNVETLNLGAGFNYNLTTNDATVASGQTLTVNGSALGSANSLTFNGAAETNGIFNITAGAGNDVLTGGSGNDTFTPGAGNDTISAGVGNDTIAMATNLTAADQIDGGAGTDTVTLSGNYAGGVVFTATTMVNVENLNLTSSANYNLTTNDATVAAGQTLTVDATAIAAGKTLTFNGSAETNGFFNIKGGAGNDAVIMAGNLVAADQINGNAGTDTVTLTGDYSAGLTFGATTMVNVENLTLGAGFNYKFTTNDATVASGQTLTVDASALAAANTLTFSGAAETNGIFNIKGGAGNDAVTGGAGNDTFTPGAGNDAVSAGAGNDTIVMAANLTAADAIDGGSGTDTVTLAGDYSAGLIFGPTTMVNVETLTLGAGFSYSLTTNDATVASGQTLTVDGSALASTKTLTFNGAAETNGIFNIKGGAGSDALTGGAGNDTVTPGAGSDTVTTGAGNDTIIMAGNLNAADRVDGGTGTDTLTLAGDYSAGVTFSITTMVNVEALSLGTGFNYNLTTNNATVASGQTLSVDGSALAAANTLTFNGAAETNGIFNIKGGAGNDVLTGGAGADTFTPGTGNDTVAAGAGNDMIVMSINLTAADQIDGGTGTDTVTIAGDYSAGLTFGATTMVNVETLSLSTGSTYNLTTNDATVAAGQTLTVSGSGATALIFNGAAETNGAFNITTGTGDDVLTGGAGADTFTPGTGGNEIISAGAGNDTVVMSQYLTAADQIDGGAGADTVTVSGDYSAGLTFGATTMVNVETLSLGAATAYNFTTNDATVAAAQTLTVSGSSATTLTFNGAAETNGSFNITSGNGDDVLTGGALADTFNSGSGSDTINAGTGNDTIVMTRYLSAADKIDGGAGIDTVSLSGDYSTGVVFTATTMLNVETLTLGAGSSAVGPFQYNLTTNDATVAAGQTLIVDGSALASTNALTFNGAAETNGSFNITSGGDTDALTGGALNDVLNSGAGNDTLTPGTGNDTVNAGAGADTIIMAANLTAADVIDGGADSDTMTLSGNYSAGLTFGATTMVNVENLSLGAGFSYKFTTNDATVASGQSLTVDASALASTNTLTFTGSAETNGTFSITGGAGNDVMVGGSGIDTLTGGSGNDSITGGAGADTLSGGAGTDTFVYTAVSNSASTNYDTISDIDFSTDRIDLTTTVTAIDTAITTGALNTASFDTDLATAMSGHLGASHAILFTADSGTLTGQTFLIVDSNATAGYQANSDIVFNVTGLAGTLATTDFI